MTSQVSIPRYVTDPTVKQVRPDRLPDAKARSIATLCEDRITLHRIGDVNDVNQLFIECFHPGGRSVSAPPFHMLNPYNRCDVKEGSTSAQRALLADRSAVVAEVFAHFDEHSCRPAAGPAFIFEPAEISLYFRNLYELGGHHRNWPVIAQKTRIGRSMTAVGCNSPENLVRLSTALTFEMALAYGDGSMSAHAAAFGFQFTGGPLELIGVYQQWKRIDDGDPCPSALAFDSLRNELHLVARAFPWRRRITASEPVRSHGPKE